MVVDCSWADAQLATDPLLSVAVPVELRTRILESRGSGYLDALAEAALTDSCADRIFTLYKPLVADLFARWTSSSQSRSLAQDVSVISCLAKVLPFAPYMGSSVRTFLDECRLSDLLQRSMDRAHSLDDGTIRVLLLALFRFLSYDRDAFVDILKPVFFTPFFSHQLLPVRYLAILSFCEVMHFADALCEKLLLKYVGNENVSGTWEGEIIDYRLLKLFEEHRWEQVEQLVCTSEAAASSDDLPNSPRFTETDLDANTANIAGALLPRGQILQNAHTAFVKTPTACRNLRSLGQGLQNHKPILIHGSPDSGKSTLIREAARLLDKEATLVTLHLNEQTDAKSLLGLYASSSTGDSFVWHPGVLTRAMQEGRWVLIEDIDRAPSEVLGVLRPLLEKHELFLSSRKQRIRPRDGFRILATITTRKDTKGKGAGRNLILSNNRLWNFVRTEEFPYDEAREIILHRYPMYRSLLDAILEAHKSIMRAYDTDARFRPFQARLPSLRDLLKLSRRIALRLSPVKDGSTEVAFTDEALLDIFKDSVDCYAAFQSNDRVFQATASLFAQCLNISPEMMKYCLTSRPIKVQDQKFQVQLGRSLLSKMRRGLPRPQNFSPFAFTHEAQRSIDAIAAGIASGEPVLLVGETGVGKTTLVQHISEMVGQKLTVVNLSQQSEATDLLGGLKPITTRSLIIPLIDQFSVLFDDTFSVSRNQKFQLAISKAITKQNWTRLLLLWQEAVQLAENALKSPGHSNPDDDSQASKRRKLDNPRYQLLRERWKDFASRIGQVKVQVDRGDYSHAFAFVEGRLVQAVRNGEWVLLDEINLASPDTLDHIVGLLYDDDDARASLLLTEAGSVETIQAHPNFRIFAAMNPATDTGKMDLAPGVRSRFTELQVSPGDHEHQDLVKIIETYLGSTLTPDRRVPSDLAKAYLELQRLNFEHKLTDGAGEKPHFSIRSLVRCLMYMQQHSFSHGLRRAMHEGFAMSFFTTLSKESEKLALPLINIHLLAHVKNPKSFLQQQPKLNIQEDKFVAFRHHLVLKGPLGCDHQPHYIRTASVERNLINLARAASMRRFPILLQGPTSVGKTSMIEYLAKFSGNRFVRINNHEHTDLQEYLGNYTTGSDGRLEYKEGVLVEALRQGHWIVLDELNLAPSDVLEALNRLLDDNRELLIPESQEVVKPHPNFMLFATQNPAGLYGGRKRFSRAFRNRFLELQFDDIPEDELEIILRERSQLAPSFCRQIVEVYKKLALQRQASKLFEQRNTFATLRDLFRWASRPVEDRQQLGVHGFMLLGERIRNSEERDLVRTTIEETLRIRIDVDQLYAPTALSESVFAQSQEIIWTPAMRRLFVLVSKALQNDEPVLLVGETGCGKTQICQTVAQLFGRRLNIYNAHSNTESSDLIGSQRPIRQRTELGEDLIRDFKALPPTALLDVDADRSDVEELIATFHQMDTSKLDQQIVAKTKADIAAYQSLFTWVDGGLVRAMKSGDHFLLDEISLADDSVLERLNSLLEPSRTILLAEKGSVDNLITAAPHFQFLATMNPGGDYGKRELSAALRNRLTEIWVPPLSDEQDILPVIQAKLGHLNQHFASAMLDFSRWFFQTLQNSQSSHLPLRSLLGWAEFVCQHQSLGSEAFVQGAAMVFIDSVGTNAVGSYTTNTLSTKQLRNRCLEKLQSLVDVNATAIYNTNPTFNLTPSLLQVGCFNLSRTRQMASIPEFLFNVPTTLKSTLRIVRALQMSRPILLEGNPGVGKTAIVTALAHVVGKSFVRINLSDQTDLMDLFGADSPSENEKIGIFSWKDGPLLQAMQSGGWILLDEMNLASQSVLEGLNACLDHRQEVYVAELDKTFKCHPDFVLFAAQNPHSQGGGRKGLPASFVNRFTVVYADPFDHNDLMQICESREGPSTREEVSQIISTISRCESKVLANPAFALGGPWELNLRDVNRWLDLCQFYPSLKPATHFETIVGQRFRTAIAKSIITKVCEASFGATPASSLYQNLSSDEYQLGVAFLKRHAKVQETSFRNFLPTSSLSCAGSVITAINQNWPVILTGPSGSGKSLIIRHLAALAGVQLVEFSMNAEIDTIDLIGGFEQHDLTREVEVIKRQICKAMASVIAEKCSSEALDSELFDSVIHAYEKLTSSNIDIRDLAQVVQEFEDTLPVLGDFKAKLHQLSELDQDNSSRFVWNDGTLIDALRNGSWLVLDDANLCNSSVLDRLNSLLEPNGSIVISEQHNSTGQARIVRPHPDFRIFLTTDPKNGELSRAMRNRSLELYVDGHAKESKTFETPNYPTTSSINRLRPWTRKKISSSATSELGSLEPCWDNLSVTDLLTLQPGCGDDMKIEIEMRLVSREYEESIDIWHNLMTKKSQALPHLSTSFSDVQPNVLLFNEPLAQMICNEQSIRQLQLWYRVQHLLTRIGSLSNQISRSIAEVESTSEQSLTIIQRTSPQGLRSLRSGKRQYPPVCDFLKKATRSLGSSMMSMSRKVTETEVTVYMNMANFLQDVLHFFNQPHFQQQTFQAYLQIGYSLLRQVATISESLATHLSAALISLGSSIQLQTGRSLQLMWPSWRPMTATSRSQLQAQLSMEALIGRFDNLYPMLPYARSDLASVRLRLVEAYSTVTIRQDAPDQIKILNDAIDKLEQSKNVLFIQRGHFEVSFEEILKRLSFYGSDLNTLGAQEMILFSRQKSLFLPSPDSPFSPSGVLRRFSAIAPSAFSTDISAMPGRFSVQSFLTSLATVKEQPLFSLQYAKDELSQLFMTIASYAQQLTDDSLGRWKTSVQMLLYHILVANQDNLNSKLREILAKGFSTSLLEHFGNTNVEYVVPSQDRARDSFHDIYSTYLSPALTLLTLDTMQAVCSALIFTAIGALKLLVPDKIFDPALLPALVAERHANRVAEATKRIRDHQKFQQDLTGQQTTAVIRLLERDLSNLGEIPTIPAVVRPEQSELESVQQEFSSLLRTLAKFDTQQILQELGRQGATLNIASFRKNIATILARVAKLNRAYDDMVKPVSWLLQCLDLGFSYLLTTPESSEMQNASTCARHVPLLGARPKDVEASCQYPLESVLSGGEDVAMLWISQLGLQRSVECPNETENSRMMSAFVMLADRYYLAWQSQLSRDQAKSEKESRYYAYRGDNEDSEDIGETEVSELFPSFTYDEGRNEDREGEPFDSRRLSTRFANAHTQLLTNQNKQEHLRAILLDALRILQSTKSDLNFEPILPAVFLSMEKAVNSLRDEIRPEPLNIYIESSVQESKKLLDLLNRTHSRFHQIAERWPEHAVPAEVLAFCSQTCNLLINEPIAKLLAKAEKLFELVSQWQAIASREWSVINLVEDLTTLIIHWRRLELSSWSGLLQSESNKQEEDAKAWYFIAFESILYNSRHVIEQKEGLSGYVLELIRTLEDFIKTATVGQFSTRLSILSILCATLQALAVQDQRLETIQVCVSKVIEHYKRYQTSIERQLGEGKQQLENKIKEQIQLASWKDTNVIALKESSRRSHYKLFRIVKKFRALLNQPVQSFEAELTDLDVSLIPELSIPAPSVSLQQLSITIKSCSEGREGWSSRPSRIVDPIGATQAMRYAYKSVQTSFMVAEEVRAFRTETKSGAENLRRQTPATMNEENASLVREVKQQKRRLLAETIKSVSKMGIRRNLGTKELSNQASTAIVLTKCLPIVSSSHSNIVSSLEPSFHEVIDLMPNVRVALGDHSEDLTEGEVRRGVGLLEGLLSEVMQQRSTLSRESKSISRFAASMQLLMNLQRAEIQSVQHWSVDQKSKLAFMRDQAAWLSELLETSIHIVNLQATRAGFDAQEVMQKLEEHRLTLRQYVHTCREQSVLPSGLCHTEDVMALRVFSDYTVGLNADLTSLIQRWPSFAYLLEQLKDWAVLPTLSSPYANGVATTDIDDLDVSCQRVSNATFVALQGMTEKLRELPASLEDERWLVKASQTYADAVGVMHLDILTTSVEDILRKLGNLPSADLHAGIALVSVMYPTLQQCHLLCQDLYGRQLCVLLETCRLAEYLGRSFVNLSKNGFCTPPEPSDGQEQTGKVESGTGLGDGEGAEDISKDIGDDEDLSEFAKGGTENEEEKSKIEKSKDAADVGLDDLEGETGSEDERNDEDGESGKQSDDDDDQDMDEEAASIDELDPSAVDEKMWEDMQNKAEEEQKEMKSQNSKGPRSDEQVAKEGESAEDNTDMENGKVQEDEDENIEEDTEGKSKAEQENVDPHLHEEETLDLPEDMQLNGEEQDRGSEISDEDFDQLSDVDDAQAVPEGVKIASDTASDSEEEDEAGNTENNEIDRTQDDDTTEEQPQDAPDGADAQLNTREDTTNLEMDDEQIGESGLADQHQSNASSADNDAMQGRNEVDSTMSENTPKQAQNSDAQQFSDTKQGSAEQGVGREDTTIRKDDDALKQLADALEQYHKRREILTASEIRQHDQIDQDLNMADADFEHLVEENETSDAQALGAATGDQAQDTDPAKAIEDHSTKIEDDLPMPDDNENALDLEQETLADRFTRLQTQQAETPTGVGQNPITSEQKLNPDLKANDEVDVMDEDKVSSLVDLPADQDQNPSDTSQDLMSINDAIRLWAECTSRTHALSLHLTEQLRLVLQPTTATKLRGDFRTGKRLNIRRIIPYIASGYKRDKIWMRRSVPTKRNYQVMLAVDDSKSMSECGADVLALETLCMLARSLSMLEVGDLCVVAFGGSDSYTKSTTKTDPVRVAHPFGEPFTSNSSGPDIFRSFSFTQTNTDVKALVRESIALFRDARIKSSAREASELWQLQLIVSDGHCSDHESIRRLVRQAREEKILIVFVIVDNHSVSANSAAGQTDGTGTSIVDLKEAVFERRDPSDENSDMIVKTKRYLESFPFQYYVVVKDVVDLPAVLARLLKGWFESVMDT